MIEILLSENEGTEDLVDRLLSLLPDKVYVEDSDLYSHEAYEIGEGIDFEKTIWLRKITPSEAVKEKRRCLNCKYLPNDKYPCNKCDDDYCMWEAE